MKKILLSVLVGFVLISFLLPTTAYAQKSERDWQKVLEEMREEIKEKGLSFTVDYNPACEYLMTDLCGFNSSLGTYPDISKVASEPPKFRALTLPDRYIGVYTPPKDQLYCGSCWAFCMVGAVEGLMKKIMGTDENMSEQWLVDCNPWGWDCDGGFINFNMFLTGGAPSETCYPYYGNDYLPCDTTCPPLYFIYDWDWVYAPGYVAPVDDIKEAIMEYGSVAVGIRATSYLQAYSGGVFDQCTTGSSNHCVVLCGWDDDLGTSGAWLLKNSWGTGWGGVDIDESGIIDPDEGGFAWIVYGCNNVGDSAAYPIPYFGG